MNKRGILTIAFFSIIALALISIGVLQTTTGNAIREGNDALFVEQYAPSTLLQGETTTVSITYKNTGTTTWTTEKYTLALANPLDRPTGYTHNPELWDVGRVQLPHNVTPGGEVTITFNITAPYQEGTYYYRWRFIYNEQERFGRHAPDHWIQVEEEQVPTNNALFVTQNSPDILEPGQKANVSITFLNTGTTTWNTSYLLAPARTTTPGTWDVGRVHLPREVPPGEQVTIPFTITTPTTEGEYPFVWRLLYNEDERFGSAVPDKIIKVRIVNELPTEPYCRPPNGAVFDNGLSRECYRLTLPSTDNGAIQEIFETKECITEPEHFADNKWEINHVSGHTENGEEIICAISEINTPNSPLSINWIKEGGKTTLHLQQDYNKPHPCGPGNFNWIALQSKKQGREPAYPHVSDLVTQYNLKAHNEGENGHTKYIIRIDGFMPLNGTLEKFTISLLDFTTDGTEGRDNYPQDPAVLNACDPETKFWCPSIHAGIDMHYFGYNIPLDQETTVTVEWREIFDYLLEHAEKSGYYFPQPDNYDDVIITKTGIGFEIYNSQEENSRKSDLYISNFEVLTTACDTIEAITNTPTEETEKLSEGAYIEEIPVIPQGRENQPTQREETTNQEQATTPEIREENQKKQTFIQQLITQLREFFVQ